jgi:hypothetical protein
MASAGYRKRVSTRSGRISYQVWWIDDFGAQGATTVATKDEAVAKAAEQRVPLTRAGWPGRKRGRLPFSTWADEWWATWAGDDRSPNTLAAAESRLRLHVRPWFDDRPIERIGPAEVRRWQAQLASRVGHDTVARCGSLARRIFQFAMDEGAIEANPVRKVPPPTRRTGTGAAPPRPRGVLHHHTNCCRMTVTTLVRPRPGGLVGQTLAHSEGSHRAARH